MAVHEHTMPRLACRYDSRETTIEIFHGLYDTGESTEVLMYARTLGLAVVSKEPAEGFYLIESNSALKLNHAGEAPEYGVFVNLDSPDIRRRAAAGKRLALARAMGLQRQNGLRVLDATCGLGRDSAVLSALGCRVTALERHPALHALLADGLRRIRRTAPGWRGEWNALHHTNAFDWLSATTRGAVPFDAIYIDPMFDTPRRKARPQRALQWLHALVGVDKDSAELLALARDRCRRVVVKSHARAAPLAVPDHQVMGKAMRFDIYFSASNDLR